ncbi:MAG TPA: hypothetical protein VNI83_10670 [Vicinamibacterales bacterium]|nr:hypothetical protein [Vicinamibacterales bacterium]
MTTPTAEELRDEQRRLRYVQFIVDFTSSVIVQGGVSREEAEALVAAAREKILALFPGSEQTYEILYARRFARLVEACTASGSDPSGDRGRIIPFPPRR